MQQNDQWPAQLTFLLERNKTGSTPLNGFWILNTWSFFHFWEWYQVWQHDLHNHLLQALKFEIRQSCRQCGKWKLEEALREGEENGNSNRNKTKGGRVIARTSTPTQAVVWALLWTQDWVLSFSLALAVVMKCTGASPASLAHCPSLLLLPWGSS